MDNEPEVIRQQMDDTRSAMTEKIELLERQVTETVQNATSAVTETVDTVKQAVQDTVESVRETVHETVSSVKDTFDLPQHVERRPWGMMAGATFLGFLGGYLCGGSGREERGRERDTSRSRDGGARGGMEDYYPASRSTGNGHTASATATSTGEAQAKEPGILESLGQTFENEIHQLKGLAVGTMLGLFRDLLAQSVPASLERQVEEVFDNITTKLGGQPIRGHVLSEAPAGTEQAETCSKRDPVSNGRNI